LSCLLERYLFFGLWLREKNGGGDGGEEGEENRAQRLETASELKKLVEPQPL